MIKSSSDKSVPEFNSDLLYARVAGHVFNTPLLVHPDVAETIGAYVRSRMEGVKPEANRFVGRPVVGPAGDWKGYRREGAAGIISIMGELVNRGAWLGASSGLTSYEGILHQVRSAAADGEVETIVLDINSPGGEAFGMADTARGIRGAANGKKIVAVINSVGASAAYGLATSADEIVVTESGIAGSIGVVMVHYDQSERVAKAGVKATVITNTDGIDKARGNSFTPLTEDDVAFLRAKADRIMDGFVKLVMDHRPALTNEAIRGQRARTFIGEDAVAAGLADRVGTFEEVMKKLSARARPSPRRQNSSMSGGPVSPISIASAREQGRAEAAERIGAILSSPAAVGRMSLAQHLAFKTAISVEDAIATLEASANEKAQPSLAALMALEPGTPTGVPSYSTSSSESINPQERGRQIALKALGKV